MKKIFFGFLAMLMIASAALTIVPPKEANATILPIIWMFENAKTKGEPSPLGHSEETKKNSLPVSGEKSLSSKDLVKDGKVVQRRYYDGSGKAEMDIDYDHSDGDGTHTFPHRHNWYWPEVGPPSRGPGY
ncbi:hypothetical protein [Paenibacillus lentus]|uniref:Uncharacterized protein n=1 Tax=Paenibacillus lentus TaxID=1338368 RepID=A0A3Q8S3F1_9BACL|nr:hypothetical protein [Paenibacillus lentus]AZK44966.1 hypothetical protein EIM92_01125 [Paenibacillus lentus]